MLSGGTEIDNRKNTAFAVLATYANRSLAWPREAWLRYEGASDAH